MLRRAEKKRCQLLLTQIGINGAMLVEGRPNNNNRGSNANGSHQHQTTSRSNHKKISSDRTTALLLSILCVFLLTELPQGGIAILNAVYTADVHRFIYLTLGDVLDLLSLVNSSVNFVLYCLMSSRYRQTFCSLFLPIQVCKRCVAHAHSVPLASFASAQPAGTIAEERERKTEKFRQLKGGEISRRRSTPVLSWLRPSPQHSTAASEQQIPLQPKLSVQQQHLLNPNTGF